MNCYSTLPRLKRFLNITDTDRDADLLFCLEMGSRAVDAFCSGSEFGRRHFFIETATRYFDGLGDEKRLPIDDLLTLTSLDVDNDGDMDYTDESWTEGTDFVLWPYNRSPKTEIRIAPEGDYSHNSIQRGYKIAGDWGYGDGISIPTEATGVTGTVAGTTSTSLTISVSAGLEAGQTILVGTERMFVSAVSTTTAAVKRGVNGSTAAAHTAAAISVYRYPLAAQRVAIMAAVEAWKELPKPGIQMESIGGEYTYQISTQSNISKVWLRALGELVRQ